MIGQKEIALNQHQFNFPNRILVLDDASSSYDLNNVTREALLWRQLAYHPEKEQRQQIFLSSHHDDLTNRLIDLLVPPPGCKLRVLRFNGWDEDNGPDIEAFDVVPATPYPPNGGDGIPSTTKTSSLQAELKEAFEC